MAHARLRKINMRNFYSEQLIDNDLCQVVAARGTMMLVPGQIG